VTVDGQGDVFFAKGKGKGDHPHWLADHLIPSTPPSSDGDLEDGPDWIYGDSAAAAAAAAPGPWDLEDALRGL